MELLDQLAELGRPTFFNGQRLNAADLQGLEAISREMRWLHNKSLHQPGIGSGYAVLGKKGDKVVTVKPGYALDADGREIVLTTEQVIQVPPVAGESDGTSAWYFLTVSYPDETTLPTIETRDGICSKAGAVRLQVEPVICWVRVQWIDGELRAVDAKLAQRIDAKCMILLAQAEVLNCQLNTDLTVKTRRNAKPPLPPLIATGQVNLKDALDHRRLTLSGEPMPADAEARELKEAATGLDVEGTQRLLMSLPIMAHLIHVFDVDTTAAGFITTPQYTARIEGNQPKRLYLETNQKQAAQPGGDILVESLLNIVDPTPQKFTVEIRFLFTAARSGPDIHELLLSAERLPEAIENQVGDWSLVWLGIEV